MIKQNHPSKKIIGEETDNLMGKKIVLGVTGSVSIYKSIDLARKIMRNGGEVTVVMSNDASKMISPELFQWATGNPVYHERFKGETGHIYLTETHDAMIIAPSTANTISKIANGITDTPVTLTAASFIGRKKPVLIVASMHKQLYDNPQLQESLKKLSFLPNIHFHPIKKEDDKIKFPEEWDVEWHLECILHKGKDLKGYKLIVTGGPTREYIDPIRYLSNPSSGKMGLSLALEAKHRGAKVTFIHGPISINPPYHLNSINIETLEDLIKEIEKKTIESPPNAIIMAAAPADFKPNEKYNEKIESNKPLNLTFKPARKVFEEINKKLPEKTIKVGFAAETAEEKKLIEKAREKLGKHHLDLIIANNVSRRDIGFESDYNEITIIKKNNEMMHIKKQPKRMIARKILDIVGELLIERKNSG